MLRLLFSLLFNIGLAAALFAQPEPDQDILDVSGKPSGNSWQHMKRSTRDIMC